jgi:hypothetical protein
MPGKPPEPPRDDSKHADRALIALLFILALAVAGWFLVQHIQEGARIQDCVMAGRGNCAPAK